MSDRGNPSFSSFTSEAMLTRPCHPHSLVLVTLLSLAAGAAWADPASGSSLVPEQQQARDARKGLWAAENPQPPWEFRKAGETSWQPSA